MNFLQGGLFKQIKFLFSSPSKAQNVVLISETNTISKELLPMKTGCMDAPLVQKTWSATHSAKFKLKKAGEPAEEEQVLLISERSYIPLDPYGKASTKAKAKIASLPDIARVRHAQARANVSRYKEASSIQSMIITGGFVLLGIFAVITLIKAQIGGG